MKKLILMVSALILCASAVTRADYNDDVVGQQVSCKARNLLVVASKNRKALIVERDGVKTVYNTVNLDKLATDGDTYVSYVALNGQGSKADKAILTFDDRGDTLELNGETIPVHCN
jgi:hypothetical protein